MTMMKIRRNRILMLGIVLCLALGQVGCARRYGQKDSANSDDMGLTAGTSEMACPFSCAMKSDTVLARNAVGPSWIAWQTPCLPDADLVYVDLDTWDIWVMDEMGGNRRCLTCYNDNILGINFPPDDDQRPPAIHWKGDPEAHPNQPIIFFKAENENSAHRKLRNSPSIGWDNDIWALNVCSKRYVRLTHMAAREGIQHSAISDDGRWYVYPLRYDIGNPPRDFGYAKMIFCNLSVDQEGNPDLTQRFEDAPNGRMYYEPHDIRKNDSGSYTLLYTAGSKNVLDPFRYEWKCKSEKCRSANTALQTTPSRHEEFTMFSPSGKKIVWMKGPLIGLGYHADLYVSTPEFAGIKRVTWYNNCSHWPIRCRRGGAQFSRLTWKDDGTAVFFGLWIHAGPLRPFRRTELHRLDFCGQCGQRD
jgi:hypothetical protein